MELLLDEVEHWKCRKHPSQPRHGVCPTCLRNRLLLLCPDCARLRPCRCFDIPSSPSPSPSPSTAGVGAVGRVSFLIDREPAFQRSRSVASHLLLPRSVEIRPPPPENRRKSSFWWFLRPEKTKKKEDEGKMAASNLQRSRSVGFSCYSDSGVISGNDVRLKGRSWYFPSPIKAFRQPKTAKISYQRSPLCRG